MRVRLIAVVSLALFAASMTAASAEHLSLKQALAIAYRSNPNLDQARAALRALDEGVAQANAGWRPNISVTGSYGSQHADVEGLPTAPTTTTAISSHPVIGQATVTQPIFRGGRTVAEVGRAIWQVRAGRAQLTDTEQQILLAAVTAYMDVVRDTAILGFNNDNVRMLQQTLDGVREQYKAGAVTKTDVAEAETRLAQGRASAASAERQLAASRAAFANVIGRPAEALEDNPALPRLPNTQDVARDIALKQNPGVLFATANARAADYNVDDAVGIMLPQVNVSGQYQYLKDAAGTNIFATKKPQSIVTLEGQVTIPIYQGGAEEAGIRRAKQQRQQADFGIAGAQRDAGQDVDTAWQANLSNDTTVEAGRAQLLAAETSLDGVQQEQKAGERSVIDVLNAQAEVLSAQVSLATARHDKIIAAYQLLKSTGQLTARSLGLDVPLYDPRKHYEDDAGAWIGFGD